MAVLEFLEEPEAGDIAKEMIKSCKEMNKTYIASGSNGWNLYFEQTWDEM